MDGSPTQAPANHLWQNVAAGRICQVCMLTQAHDEFDDRAPCPGTRRAVIDGGAIPKVTPVPPGP